MQIPVRYLAVALAIGVFFASRGGFTSGSTRVSQVGGYYAIALETPSIVFEANPATGQSPEQAYHAEARKYFTETLARHKSWIEEKVALLRREFEEKGQIVAYDANHALLNGYQIDSPFDPKRTGPCRLRFPIFFPDMGELELSFANPPAKGVREALAGRIKALFTKE